MKIFSNSGWYDVYGLKGNMELKKCYDVDSGHKACLYK